MEVVPQWLSNLGGGICIVVALVSILYYRHASRENRP